MSDSQFIILMATWGVCAVWYGGGLVYGLRFLRVNDLVDSRTIQFTGDLLFGKIGYNYKLFYHGHSQVHGVLPTKLLMAGHILSMVFVFALPIVAACFE